MSTWTDKEIEILRNLVSDGLSIDKISNFIPNHSKIAIRAEIDRLDLNLEKSIGKVTIPMLQKYVNDLNIKQGKFLPVEAGCFGIMRHEDGFSVIQYVNDSLDYCILGSHLTKVGCYKVLQDFEQNCING